MMSMNAVRKMGNLSKAGTNYRVKFCYELNKNG